MLEQRRAPALLLAIIFTVIPVHGWAQDSPTERHIETGFLDRSVTVNGETFRYQVYVPVTYSPTALWPVILYLHGNGYQGADGSRQTNGGFANASRLERSQFEAIVVFAQAKQDTRWEYLDMQELAVAELDRTISEFTINRARVYLVGYSMGANGVYRLLYRWPDRFAGAVAVAGFVQAVSTLRRQDLEMDRQANAFVTQADPFGALASRITQIPLWIHHGDADTTVPVQQSRELVAALNKVGSARFRYTEHQGVNHNGVQQAAFGNPATLSWLFQQRGIPAP